MGDEYCDRLMKTEPCSLSPKLSHETNTVVRVPTSYPPVKLGSFYHHLSLFIMGSVSCLGCLNAPAVLSIQVGSTEGASRHPRLKTKPIFIMVHQDCFCYLAGENSNFKCNIRFSFALKYLLLASNSIYLLKLITENNHLVQLL